MNMLHMVLRAPQPQWTATDLVSPAAGPAWRAAALAGRLGAVVLPRSARRNPGEMLISPW